MLIDAHSIIFRSYFAFIKNPLRNSKGENTSGIFGFLNTLEKIRKNIKSNHMALAYDAPGKTFRDEVYEEYKATRPSAPTDIPFQVSKVKEICQYLGIQSFEIEGYEADDILATCAMKLKNEGEVYIVTSDKDLMQLVNDRIFVYDAYKDIVYNRAEVIKKYGVPPERIADFLALTGDVSDNIPGIPGIGPKRALEILSKYKTFEKAINNDKRIVGHKEQALLSRKLTILESKVPLEIKPQDLIIKKTNVKKLMAILLDLEFHSFIKHFSKDVDSNTVSKKIKDLSDIKVGSIVGISFKESKNICLCTDETKVYTISESAAKDLLENKTIMKSGYNLKDFVKTANLQPPLFDIGIVSWLIEPNKKTQRLEDIVLHNLNVYSAMTPENAAHSAFKLYPKLAKKLEECNGKKLYGDIEQPLIPVLAKMEQRGVKIDLEYFKRLSVEFGDEILQEEKKIHKLAGKRFNINSPKQLSKILFEELRLKPAKKGKTHYSTNVEVLQQLSLIHPLPGEVLKYREYAKIRSTYIEPFISAAKDNRIHTIFNQTGTATGRLSSSNPNMQNIPIRTELGRKIRKGFVASKEFLLISADYSQIELRILAHITHDKNLGQAFENNEDIHQHTASLIYNIPEDDIDNSKRRMAKVVNYGLIYGMSDYGLAQGLDIPREEAVQFIESYYYLYSEVEKWRDQAIATAEEKGYTETIFGRRRPLPDIHSDNYLLREFSKRAAINTPIQGTAADLIKKAMIEVERCLSHNKFTKGLLLSIHDELVFEIEKTRIEEAKAIIKECMEKVVKLNVPIKISIGIGENWEQAH